MSGVAVPNRTRSSTVNGLAENFRIVITGPTSDSGGMMALTREPSVRRASTIGEAFQRAQEFENPIYLGDASFLQYTHRLARGPVPLLQSEAEALALTDVGRAVLENREDRIRINGMHRWWGGVRLTGENLWRWDPDRQALRSPKRQAE